MCQKYGNNPDEEEICNEINNMDYNDFFKLEQAGMRCRLTGYNGGYIQFLGYTPETKTLLEQEREEVIIAHQAWQARRIQTN